MQILIRKGAGNWKIQNMKNLKFLSSVKNRLVQLKKDFDKGFGI